MTKEEQKEKQRSNDLSQKRKTPSFKGTGAGYEKVENRRRNHQRLVKV